MNLVVLLISWIKLSNLLMIIMKQSSCLGFLLGLIDLTIPVKSGLIYLLGILENRRCQKYAASLAIDYQDFPNVCSSPNFQKARRYRNCYSFNLCEGFGSLGICLSSLLSSRSRCCCLGFLHIYLLFPLKWYSSSLSLGLAWFALSGASFDQKIRTVVFRLQFSCSSGS